MQARGENLFSIIKAFTKSSKLQITHERESNISTANQYEEGHAVFFDYLTLFMVCCKAHDLCLSWHCWFDIYILLADVWYCLSSLSLSWWILQIYYTRKVAMLLHSIPIAIFLAASVFSKKQTPGLLSWFSTFCDFAKGKSAASYVNAFMQPCCCDRGPSFCTRKFWFSTHGVELIILLWHFLSKNLVFVKNFQHCYPICQFFRTDIPCYWDFSGNCFSNNLFHPKIAVH